MALPKRGVNILNKQELIDAVAKRTKLSKTQISDTAEALISTISGALRKGDEVKLVGFGSWRKNRRAAREGRNPQTGKAIKIPAKNVVKFSMGQGLRDLLN